MTGIGRKTSTRSAVSFFWSITSALAGFLFGFDTVVPSGAERKSQSLWGLSAGLHGVAMAAAASPPAGFPVPPHSINSAFESSLLLSLDFLPAIA